MGFMGSLMDSSLEEECKENLTLASEKVIFFSFSVDWGTFSGFGLRK